MAKIHGSYDKIVIRVEKYGQPPDPPPKPTPDWIKRIFQKERETARREKA